MNTIRRTPRSLGPVAFVVAGVLIVIGHALSVDMSDSGRRYVSALAANRPPHVAGGLVTAVAALLLSVGLAAASRVFSAEGRRVARVAATVASVGAAGMSLGLAMVAMVMGTLAGEDTGLAVRVYDILNHATLASVPFLLAYLFTVGTLVLACTLVFAGRRARWIGSLLLVGAVIDFMSPSGGLLTAVFHVPQAAAFALLGMYLLDGAGRESDPAARERTATEAAVAPLPAI
jgi:hypothetical protein